MRVSLDGIIDVADIKEGVKNEMKPKLDQYFDADFAISASKADEDVGNAEKLDPRDSLESILSRFGIEGRPTVPEAFARNVWLFVSVPTGKRDSNIFFFRPPFPLPPPPPLQPKNTNPCACTQRKAANLGNASLERSKGWSSGWKGCVVRNTWSIRMTVFLIYLNTF